MIDYGINNLHVDPCRIFLTGFSLVVEEFGNMQHPAA